VSKQPSFLSCPLKSRLAPLALSCAVLLSACGGGGGGGSDGASSAAGAGASGAGAGGAASAVSTTAVTFAGPVSGFGSVVVNGVRFASVGATLVDDEGQALALSQVKLGMTVRVDGEVDDASGDASASRIELVRGSRGPVTAVDLAGNGFSLMGQRVQVQNLTVFQGLSGLSALRVGQVVEAYGVLQADGSLQASLVELKTSSAGGVSVVGQVSGLSSNRFQLGSLVVNYSAAVVQGVLSDGARVKVSAAAAPVGGVLQASAVRVTSGAAYGQDVASGRTFKLKGVAESAPVAGVLKVAGVTVNVSQAVFRGGNAIVAGQWLEIKGRLNAGVLQATEVELEGYRESQVGGRQELYGSVSSLSGSLAVIDGVTVDLSQAVFTSGTLAQLRVGSYVEVKGNVQGNVLVATRVSLKTSSAVVGVSYEQYGVVSQFVSVANFSLNGLRVDASAARFEHGTAAALANGVYVEVKGSLNSAGVFVASKVEIKSGQRDD